MSLCCVSLERVEEDIGLSQTWKTTFCRLFIYKDRQTGRQTDKQTDRQTGRDRDRQNFHKQHFLKLF